MFETYIGMKQYIFSILLHIIFSIRAFILKKI